MTWPLPSPHTRVHIHGQGNVPRHIRVRQEVEPPASTRLIYIKVSEPHGRHRSLSINSRTTINPI